MTNDEFQIYQGIFEKLIWEPDIKLFIDTDVMTCIDKLDYHKMFKTLFTFLEKSPFPPKAKVGGAVAQNQLFYILLKIGSLYIF